MTVAITDAGGCIGITIDGNMLLINKQHVKLVDVIKGDTLRIDIGCDAFRHLYIRLADVTAPAVANIAALRDFFSTMLDCPCAGEGSGGGGGDNTAVVAKLDEVKGAVENNNNAVALQNMTGLLTQIHTALGGGEFYKDPIRIDESMPNTRYLGYSTVANLPAPASATPVWAIQKIVRNGDMYLYYWANGNRNLTNIWNDRLELNYQPLMEG